jgi:hypothetical protein
MLRKRGGQPGNRNALKHGNYSPRVRAARWAERQAEWRVLERRTIPVTDYDAICEAMRREREQREKEAGNETTSSREEVSNRRYSCDVRQQESDRAGNAESRRRRRKSSTARHDRRHVAPLRVAGLATDVPAVRRASVTRHGWQAREDGRSAGLCGLGIFPRRRFRCLPRSEEARRSHVAGSTVDRGAHERGGPPLRLVEDYGDAVEVLTASGVVRGIKVP